MADFKSLERLQQLHPKIRDKAIDAYNEAVKVTPVGVHPYITQTIRSFAESDTLYAQGRTKTGSIVTNAKGGSSLHNFALALDFMLIINGKDSWKIDENWMLVVKIFQSHGFEWGGSWKSIKDYPHFQITFGLSVAEMRKRYLSGDVFEDINGLKYINI